MSIIYDALQKTQKNRKLKNTNSYEKTTHHSHWIDIGLLWVIAVLVFLAVSAYYPQIKKYFFSPKVIKAAPALPVVAATKPLINVEEYKKNHILNGVFISATDNVALINNHIFHMGDIVDGFKLMHMNTDSVKLVNGQQVIELQVAS